MATATFKRIDIQQTSKNESICSFASYANNETDCFFLRKQTNITSSDSSKNIFIVNFPNKDLSYVTIFDDTYNSPNFYKFIILPEQSNNNLNIAPIKDKLDINSINYSKSLNGDRYRIKSSSYAIFSINSLPISKFYNLLYTNIKWNTETYSNNNFFLKRNGIKELNGIPNKEIYFRPLIKLENNESITMNIKSNRTEGNEIIEYVSDLSWNANNWNENKYLNFIDKGIGKTVLDIDISFNSNNNNNVLYDIPIEFTNYDISVNIPGIDINYDGKKKELINLNYTDLSFNIVGFNTTGNNVNGINIVAYTDSTDISFNTQIISIKNQTDSLIDPSGEYIDANNGSNYGNGNNQIYMNVNSNNIVYGSKTLRFSITSSNHYFNNIYIPNITLLVSKITKSQNYYLINTGFGTGIGNSAPDDIILSLVQDSDIDNGQSGGKIIGISMEEFESSGDISFNDLSLNLFSNTLSNAESIESQIISHIQNRENEVAGDKKMLGVKKINFIINDDTTNNKYKNTIIDSSVLELNVVCLKSDFDFYVMIEKSNSSVKILIDSDYYNDIINYNNFDIDNNDINKGRLYFTIKRDNITENKTITYDAKGTDIKIINSSDIDDTNIEETETATDWYSYNNTSFNYISITDGTGNLQFNEALNVYDTYTYTVTPKYEWKPVGSDNILTVSSGSKSLTLFMCYNNQYKYGIYNTSSTNKDMYIPLGSDGCGGLSGNIYENTTNYLTKKEVFSRLAKRNRLKK